MPSGVHGTDIKEEGRIKKEELGGTKKEELRRKN
jgi:hypothetical protein